MSGGRKDRSGVEICANTVQEFRPQIRNWFDIGSKEPDRKISPSCMLHLLEGMHPHRYDLPTKHRIQQVLSTMATEEKKQRQQASAWHLQTRSGQGGQESGRAVGTEPLSEAILVNASTPSETEREGVDAGRTSEVT